MTVATSWALLALLVRFWARAETGQPADLERKYALAAWVDAGLVPSAFPETFGAYIAGGGMVTKGVKPSSALSSLIAAFGPLGLAAKYLAPDLVADAINNLTTLQGVYQGAKDTVKGAAYGSLLTIILVMFLLLRK